LPAGLREIAAALVLSLALASPASAAGGSADPMPPIVLALAVILVGAKLAGEVCVRLGQPAVLGELLIGIVLGTLSLAGIHSLEPMRTNPVLDALAQLGVIILLFEVGLESTVRDMLKVGVSAVLVAVIGVVTPFALGWGVGRWLLPSHSAYVHAFLGATLTATSVGITARVLKDIGRSQSAEARVILGAAVIDDVLGLVILAVVGGVIQAANAGTGMEIGAVLGILGKAVLFLFGSLTLGLYLSPRLFALASRLESAGALLATALAFCFLLAYAAARVGLAPIVGAYAAGLILESVHYRAFTDRGEHELEELIRPISSFLVPIFFVLMGMHVDLASLARGDVLALAAALTLVAIAGKQACGLGAFGVDHLSVGLGMVPRGEVGLIFANIGLGLKAGDERIVDEATFSAIVVMVLVTTLVTPPALKWSFSRLPAES
jgi:Kef-type K+ transport system membrane component KefB